MLAQLSTNLAAQYALLFDDDNDDEDEDDCNNDDDDDDASLHTLRLVLRALTPNSNVEAAQH